LSVIEARRQFTRQEILTRARRVFAARGLAGTTMEDVASAIGITRATLYKYFPSKAELVAEVIKATVATFAAFIPAAETATSLQEGVTALVRQQAKLIMEVGKEDLRFVYRLMIDEIENLGPEPHVIGGLDQFRLAVVGILKLGKKRGELAPGVSLEAAAADLRMELLGLHVLWLTSPDDIDLMAAAERLIDRYLRQVAATR
jgi:AcrR family transcriptional regulator